MDFEDADGQAYQLISDQNDHGVAGGVPWRHSDVPPEFAIVGLGPVTVAVINAAHLARLLTTTLGFTQAETSGSQTLFQVGAGGHGAQVIVDHQPDLPIAEEGFGMIHHAAFTTADRTELAAWITRIGAAELPQSGLVDRYYFASTYFRAAPQILFEVATAGPGFFQDETPAVAGLHLELPPFLEPRRAAIEAKLPPLDSSWRAIP